ncbi:nuclear exosome regulator NRDE2 [Bactrocera oleae]|uniref:nuclear exosome regulator NRDE2 n=1 Tax=Bactrocera oleae TaxID=104688 RepID=UPI0017490732|nr:nuclear exosome regulator NRDE2 [Bactrocera oleae]
MSIFPAYTDEEERINNGAVAERNPIPSSSWLRNSSFALENDHIKSLESVEFMDSSCSLGKSDTEYTQKTKKHKRKAHKKKSKKKKNETDCNTQIMPILEFNGAEGYYIDKSKIQIYLTVRTLHKPACPRYRYRSSYILGKGFSYKSNVKETTNKCGKRYFRNKYNIQNDLVCNNKQIALDENEYISRLGHLNRKILQTNSDLQVWLELLSLQEQNPYKWSRVLLAEKKLDIINRALISFPRNEQLYRFYIDIITATYPSFEVTKMLDRLLMKDPYSYTLWTAQIMTTQGSMARCIVPDVLRIYERCMRKMHRAQQISTPVVSDISNADDIMLRLFNNCALFLRQAGLNEQFIALIKLALELNITAVTFKGFTPLESDQNTLIEFEELVLQSGLPMNEIWLRIEKLRQGFNFLPCPEKIKCNDPQRIVFNEDICHYIYPMESRENSFYLILLILKLLKVPFIQCEGLAEKFSAHLEFIGDSDAIEDILAVCLQRNFAISQNNQREFQRAICTLTKEMTVSPSFLSNTIGHDIYIRCVTSLLLDCAASYINIDKRKHELFIVLWCRFERLMLIFERYSSKTYQEYIKAGRKRFKNLLKQIPNRNVLIYYTEFAIYEFESLNDPKDVQSVENIFENLIASHSTDETQTSDLCYTYVTFAEILIGCGKEEKALHVLLSFAFSRKNTEKSGTGRILAALQQVTEKLDHQISIEKSVEIMVLEQYLLPDYTVSLLKVRVLIQCLIGQKNDAISYLDKLMNIFRSCNDRHRFLRECITELYLSVLQMTCPCKVPSALVRDKINNGLTEYPRNLFLLQHCGILNSIPWFRIRTNLLRIKPTIMSVIFLIILARNRYFQMYYDNEFDKQCNDLVIRNRILHIFKTLSSDHLSPISKRNALLKNALFWRLYLRFLSDKSTDFETSKKCLLTALDECPWNKALYLDGATYVPQELSHLQDLIIEKQLRIYALPEELEILRGQ